MTNNKPPAGPQHVKVSFDIKDEQDGEILIALLGDIGFEGFEQTESQLLAYIEESLFDAKGLESATGRADYQIETVPVQNWNEVWESNFQPVIINDFCTIRAHFHQIPVSTPHEIVITPKMSFGTGHHATTRLVMQLMKELDFSGKKVLDFGTGTGVLAILAERLGAGEVLAIDNDEWAVENAKENVERNNCRRIIIMKGSLDESVPGQMDIIIANINRNILLQYMTTMYDRLAAGGTIIMSGLLIDDKDTVAKAAIDAGFYFVKAISEMNWIALYLTK